MQKNYVENVAKIEEIETIDEKIKQLELRGQNLANVMDKLDEKMVAMQTYLQELSE